MKLKYIFFLLAFLVLFPSIEGFGLSEGIVKSKKTLVEYINRELARNNEYTEQLLELRKEALEERSSGKSSKITPDLKKLDKEISSFNQDFLGYINSKLTKARKYEKKLLQFKKTYLKDLSKAEEMRLESIEAMLKEEPLEEIKPERPPQPKIVEKPKLVIEPRKDLLDITTQDMVKKEAPEIADLALRSYQEGLADSVFQKEAKARPPSDTKDEALKVNQNVQSLDESIKIATIYSSELKYAKANMESAAAKTKEAARALWPFFYVEASQTEGDILEGVEFEEKKYGLSFEHTLYSSGHLGTIYKQAQKQYRAAKSKYKKAEADLCLKVAQAYYELVKAILNYYIQDDLIKEVREDLSVTGEKFSQKLVTEEELMEVRTRFNQVDFQRLSAQRDVVLARYKYIQALGVEQLKEVDTTLDFEGIEVTLDDVFALAKEGRIELQVAELMIQISEDEKRIAKTKDDLKIDITGFVGQSASYYKTEDENYKDDWSIVLKITKSFGPSSVDYSYTKTDTSPKLGQDARTNTDEHAVKVGIFDNFEQDTRIKKAQAEYEQSLKEFADVKKEVGVEAHQAYFDYGEAALRVRNSLERIKLAEQRLSSSLYQMRLNQVPLPQVLDAKIKLADEKALYVQALADYKLSLYKLDHAVGQWGKFSSSKIKMEDRQYGKK